MNRFVNAKITGENQFTDPIKINGAGTVSIQGTFTANVVLQRQDANEEWIDTGDIWTAEGVHSFTDHTNGTYRAGVKTSGYTTGEPTIYLGSSD